jgi:hypothetical protein
MRNAVRTAFDLSGFDEAGADDNPSNLASLKQFALVAARKSESVAHSSSKRLR